MQGDGRKKKAVSLNNEKEQQSWGGKGQNKLEIWSVCEFFWLRKLRKWCSNKHKWKNNRIMVYTIWFIRPTQTQLCLPKSSVLISALCKSKGRKWAQWEIHVGPLTRAELSINNWVCCSGLHLPRAAKLLLTAAASSCQPSSQTDQLPQINPHYFKPIPSFFPRNRKSPFQRLFQKLQLWARHRQEGISHGHGFTSSVWKVFQCFTRWPQPWTVVSITEAQNHRNAGTFPGGVSHPRKPGWNVFIIPSVYLLQLKSVLAAVWEWE